MSNNLGDQISNDERDDIATIMRQAQCYDVQHVYEIYKANNCDVVETICKLMSLPESCPKPVNDVSSPFTMIREILKEKYEIYYQRSSTTK